MNAREAKALVKYAQEQKRASLMPQIKERLKGVEEDIKTLARIGATRLRVRFTPLDDEELTVIQAIQSILEENGFVCGFAPNTGVLTVEW